MGKLNRFEIKLNRKTEVYCEGHYVEGVVEVELADSMKMRGRLNNTFHHVA